MKLSRSIVDAMPSLTLKDVRKKKAAEQRLARAIAFAEDGEQRVNTLKASDGGPEDSSNLEDVVILDGGGRTAVCHFLNGETRVSELAEKRVGQWPSKGIERRRWKVTGDESFTTYFSSTQIAHRPNPVYPILQNMGRNWGSYSFEEVTVQMEDGERVFYHREGSGACAKALNGLLGVAEMLTGPMGPALSEVTPEAIWELI